MTRRPSTGYPPRKPTEPPARIYYLIYIAPKTTMGQWSTTLPAMFEMYVENRNMVIENTHRTTYICCCCCFRAALYITNSYIFFLFVWWPCTKKVASATHIGSIWSGWPIHIHTNRVKEQIHIVIRLSLTVLISVISLTANDDRHAHVPIWVTIDHKTRRIHCMYDVMLQIEGA